MIPGSEVEQAVIKLTSESMMQRVYKKKHGQKRAYKVGQWRRQEQKSLRCLMSSAATVRTGLSRSLPCSMLCTAARSLLSNLTSHAQDWVRDKRFTERKGEGNQTRRTASSPDPLFSDPISSFPFSPPLHPQACRHFRSIFSLSLL